MIICIAFLSVALFAIGLYGFKVIATGSRILGTVQNSLAIMRDDSLDDLAKEKAVQKASLQLFGCFFSILLRASLAGLISILPIWLSDLAGWADRGQVIDFLSRWDVIGITTIIFIVAYYVVSLGKSAKSQVFKVEYSLFDRMLHRMCFKLPNIQMTAVDIEQSLYRKEYERAKGGRPIFVTALARAGTTLTLEVLSRLPGLAAHTYRDMPLVLSPVLWSRLTGGFHKGAELKERAHQDGMQVGFDSPEAFEEVFWKRFWPKKYTGAGIQLWDESDAATEAQGFLAEHMRKIIALRAPQQMESGRYISKNNANLARIDFIRGMFPDAFLAVILRNPLEHAVSMLRQHRNFLDMHQQSPFVRQYMADIGHYEFGQLLKPVQFPYAAELMRDKDPLGPDYWLAYWIAAYGFVSVKREAVTLVSYEGLCNGGSAALEQLCSALAIDHQGQLYQAAELIHAPPPPRAGEYGFDSGLRKQALELHEEMLALSCVKSINSPA